MYFIWIFHTSSTSAEEQRLPDDQGLANCGNPPQFGAVLPTLVRSLSLIGSHQKELYADSDGDQTHLAVRNSTTIFQTLDCQEYLDPQSFESS